MTLVEMSLVWFLRHKFLNSAHLINQFSARHVEDASAVFVR